MLLNLYKNGMEMQIVLIEHLQQGTISWKERLAYKGNHSVKKSDAKYDTGDKCLVNMLFHMEVRIFEITNDRC